MCGQEGEVAGDSPTSTRLTASLGWDAHGTESWAVTHRGSLLGTHGEGFFLPKETQDGQSLSGAMK